MSRRLSLYGGYSLYTAYSLSSHSMVASGCARSRPPSTPSPLVPFCCLMLRAPLILRLCRVYANACVLLLQSRCCSVRQMSAVCMAVAALVTTSAVVVVVTFFLFEAACGSPPPLLLFFSCSLLTTSCAATALLQDTSQRHLSTHTIHAQPKYLPAVMLRG